jgi:hypothetical protein
MTDDGSAVETSPAPLAILAPDSLFDEFWAVYPRRVGKAGAQHAWRRLAGLRADPRLIIAAAERYRDECRRLGTESKFIAHASSWLGKGRYEDEEPEQGIAAPPSSLLEPSPAMLTRGAARAMTDEELIFHVAGIAHDRRYPITAATQAIKLVIAQRGGIRFPLVGIDRGSELATMPYPEYLETLEWQARRKAMLAHADHRCQVCNRDSRLNVHHRTYERRGMELPSDLIVLCEDCHGLYHGKGRLAAEDA